MRTGWNRLLQPPKARETRRCCTWPRATTPPCVPEPPKRVPASVSGRQRETWPEAGPEVESEEEGRLHLDRGLAAVGCRFRFDTSQTLGVFPPKGE